MEQYKKEFIEFMVDSQVLKFGEFTLKSGRKSPFFMPIPVLSIFKFPEFTKSASILKPADFLNN